MVVLRLRCVLLLAWPCLSQAVANFTVPRNRPPIFVMDLDKPARERWRGALSLFRDPPEKTWIPIFHWHNRSVFDACYPKMFQEIGAAVRKNWPDMAEELDGMSDEFRSVGLYVSYEYLATWAYSHELAHINIESEAFQKRKCESFIETKGGATPFGPGCTAVIAQDMADNIHHVAIMDQVPIEIRWVVLHIRFVRSGVLVFEGADWYWFTAGVTRALRPGLCSLQENWRTIHPFQIFDFVYDDILRGALPQTWVFRYVLEHPPLAKEGQRPFEAVRDFLAEVFLAAPFYVAIGGAHPGEGAVFARSRPMKVTYDKSQGGFMAGYNPDTVAGPDDVEKLNATDGTWYLVQTNFDRWLPDDPYDMRRETAEQALDEAGRTRGATALGLLGVANMFPVRNPTSAFVVIMSASTGLFEPFILEPTNVIDNEGVYQALTYAQMKGQNLYGATCIKSHANEFDPTARSVWVPLLIVLVVFVGSFARVCMQRRKHMP